MKAIEFTINNAHYKRVSAPTAKRLFMSGHTLIVAPCNANPHFKFFPGARINNRQTDFIMSDNLEKEFDRFINAYWYYNCNIDLGNYLSYYLEIN